LLRKHTGKDVCRIRFIARWYPNLLETEKNYRDCSTTLKTQDVDMFFDEEDALVRKRTEIVMRNDKYATQEVARMCCSGARALQRNRWILATNQRSNMTMPCPAALQVFTSISNAAPEGVHMIWQMAFSAPITIDGDIIGGDVASRLRVGLVREFECYSLLRLVKRFRTNH